MLFFSITNIYGDLGGPTTVLDAVLVGVVLVEAARVTVPVRQPRSASSEPPTEPRPEMSAVSSNDARELVAGVVVLLDARARGAAFTRPQIGVAQPGDDGVGEAGDIIERDERARIAQRLVHPVDVERDDAAPHRHGFEGGERHSLPPRRHGDDVGGGQPVGDVVAMAGEGDRRRRVGFEFGPVGTVADQRQSCAGHRVDDA